eukprot:g10258.t1
MCDGFTRRRMMQVGGIASLGLSLPQLLNAESSRTSADVGEGTAKSVILINLMGGPSHLDMFDMKPAAPVEVRGEFAPISSSLPGVSVCEHLPLTAKTLHLSTLIRTHTHLYNTHSPYNLLTGYSGPVIVNNSAKPDDHPCIGSVMRYLGKESRQVPSFVWMPTHPGHSQSKRRAGPYGGFLGKRYDPLFTTYTPKFDGPTEGRSAYVDPPVPIGDPQLTAIAPQPGLTIDRMDRRRSLLQQLDELRGSVNRSTRHATMSQFQEQALQMLTSRKTHNAFDLSKEPASSRARYGNNLFGSSLLTARRLVEAGARFVGVTTESQLNGKVGAGQWDTHSNNFRLLKNFNLPALDRYYSGLITDLEERGLLDSTLVILMGEMGRTPKVNRNSGGRDHWTQCGFILLTGGGVKRGNIVGKSDRQAAWPIERPVTSADHVATVYQLLGINPDQTVPDHNGRPIRIALDGQPALSTSAKQALIVQRQGHRLCNAGTPVRALASKAGRSSSALAPQNVGSAVCKPTSVRRGATRSPEFSSDRCNGGLGVSSQGRQNCRMRIALLLTFEKLPLSRYGCYGDPAGLTPAFDRFAAESVVFDNHFAENVATDASGHAWSCGRYQFPLSADAQQRDRVVLADMLRTAGVTLHEFPAVSADGRQFSDVVDEIAGALADDVRIPEAGVLFHIRADGVSIDTHGDDAEADCDRQLQEIDAAFGRLFDSARAAAQSHTCDLLVLVTAAEGVDFGAQSHLPDPVRRLGEAVAHTPLIVFATTGEAGTRRSALVQTVDIVPTLAEWFGLPSDATTCDGFSLLPLVRGEREGFDPVARTCAFIGDGLAALGVRDANDYLILRSLDDDPLNSESMLRLFSKPEDIWEIHDPGIGISPIRSIGALQPRFSPDGKRIAVSYQGAIWALPTSGGVMTRLTSGKNFDVAPVWSPDGRFIAFVNSPSMYAGPLRVIEADTGRPVELPVPVVALGTIVYQKLEFHQNGRSILGVFRAGGRNYGLSWYDLKNGKITPVAELKRWSRYALSNDSETVYFTTTMNVIGNQGGNDGQAVDLWKVKSTGGKPQKVTRFPARIHDLCVAADNRSLFVATELGGVHNDIWQIPLDAPERQRRKLTNNQQDEHQPAVSKDGRQLVYTDNSENATALVVRDLKSGETRPVRITGLDYRTPTGQLTVTINDKTTGDPVTARVSIERKNGKFHAPPGALYRVLKGYGHFYANGKAELHLPAGDYQLKVFRGPEYHVLYREFTIKPGKKHTETLAATRWVHNARRGWYSGENHIHANYGYGEWYNTPATMLRQCAGENLNVCNFMVANSDSNGVFDREFFRGRPDVNSTPETILYWNQEFRSTIWGHMTLVNLKQVVEPVYTGFKGTTSPWDIPTNSDIADKTHLQKGHVNYTHVAQNPDDPYQNPYTGKGIPIEAALGKVDTLDLNGSYRGTIPLWYRLLNCGFHLPASAGTDCFLNRVRSRVPGGDRVYVRVKGALTYEKWIQGLKAGRSFVTNGPMPEFSVDNKSIGDIVRLATAGTVRVRARGSSRIPISRIELIQNGKVVATGRLAENRLSGTLDTKIPVATSGWLALRIVGPDHIDQPGSGQYAHTSPIYIDVAGKPFDARAEAAFFLKWIDRLALAVRVRDRIPSDRLKAHVRDQFEAARVVYRRLLARTPTGK